MNTTKQTIVEMRFPVTQEVLEVVRLEAQQEGNDIFFRYVFVTEGTPKEATVKAREYFNSLFLKCSELIVTSNEVQSKQKPDEQHIEQITNIKKYKSEDNVV